MNVLRFSDLVAAGKVAGRRVFIRADLNVPQDDAGHVTEDTRIRASLPCIRMALDAGAAVMVTSHLGRPTEGAFKPEDSLAPVAQRMAELLGRDVPLLADLWATYPTLRVAYDVVAAVPADGRFTGPRIGPRQAVREEIALAFQRICDGADPVVALAEADAAAQALIEAYEEGVGR